jgi:hypothetical protein
MHGTLDRRVADTAAWIYYIEQTVSRAYARYKNCFAAGAAIDQIRHFITLRGDTELRLKKSAATMKVSSHVKTNSMRWDVIEQDKLFISSSNTVKCVNCNMQFNKISRSLRIFLRLTSCTDLVSFFTSDLVMLSVATCAKQALVTLAGQHPTSSIALRLQLTRAVCISARPVTGGCE